MDPFLGVMFVLWCIKVLAEDGYATVTGQSNPRLDRRRARQKSRANNPIWTQFVGWLGDVAEDARTEQARARQEKREREAEARRKRDLEEHPTVDAEYTIDPDPQPQPAPAADQEEPRRPRSHAELTADECDYDICPIHGKGRQQQPEPEQTRPNQNTGDAPNQNTEGDDMSEIQGLDQAIAYAAAVAAMASKHATAGNEGYIGHLTERNVSGEALQSAHDMQAAMSGAMAAAEHHKSELEKQKAVQEAYDQNPDAGDQEFQTAGR